MNGKIVRGSLEDRLSGSIAGTEALLGNEDREAEKERSVRCKYKKQERNGSDDSEKEKEVEGKAKIVLLSICHWKVCIRRVI